MKIMKTGNLLIALSLVAVSASCAKENVGENADNNTYNDTFKVSFNTDKVETKVYYDKTENVCWAEGDAIGIFANNGSCPSADNLQVTGEVSEGGATATFNAELTYAGDGDYSVVAYYPYRSSVTYNQETSLLASSIPNVQTMYKGPNNDSYDPNADFLIATPALNVTGKDVTVGALEFNRIFAPVCFTFNDSQNIMAEDEMIASVVLSVPEEVAVAGNFKVNVQTGELQFSKVKNSVMVTLDEGYKAGSEVYMVVAPVAAETLAGQNVVITVHTTHASYQITKTGGKFLAGKLNGATLDLKDATVINAASSVTLHKAEANTEEWTITDFAVDIAIQTTRTFAPKFIPFAFAGYKVAINSHDVRLGGTIVPETDGRVYMITRAAAKNQMLEEGWAPATPVNGITDFILDDNGQTKILVWTKIAKAGDEIDHVLTEGTWNPAQVIAPAIELYVPTLSDVQSITVKNWSYNSAQDTSDNGYSVIDLPAAGIVGLVSDRANQNNNAGYSLSYVPAQFKGWKALATPRQTAYGGVIVPESDGYIYIIGCRNFKTWIAQLEENGWEPITNIDDPAAEDYVTFVSKSYAFYRKSVTKGQEVAIPDSGEFDQVRDHYYFPIAPSITLEPAAE